MNAAKILKAATVSRAAYDTIAAAMEPAELGVLNVPIWDEIRSYYERDESARTVDVSLLTDRMSAAQAGDKRATAMRRLLEEIWAEDVSAANVADYCREHALDTAAMKLASAVAARRGRDEVDRLARSYTTLLDAPTTIDEQEETVRWSEVLRKRLDTSQRIQVSPPCLNKRLGGGVFPGTNIIIMMRPELGKTALALTMACGFARRGLRGLYLCNEESTHSLMVRAAANFTMLSEAELAADPDQAERTAIAKGAGNIVFRDMSPGSAKEIERLVARYKPSWVVVDQIRNITVKDTDGAAAAMEHKAQVIRNIGKKYGPITIGITQAGDSATDKLQLGLSDIDSSKTGVPGAGDVVIGGGATAALDAAGQRCLTLCKNKVSGIHDSWYVNIDKIHSKYTSIK